MREKTIISHGLTPRALIVSGWVIAFGFASAAFVIAAAMPDRPGRIYYPENLIHFSLLALGAFAIDRFVRAFPLSGRYPVARVLAHALFATALSTVAGLFTGLILGIIDGLKGYQHLVNVLMWHVTPGYGRVKLLIIEQLFYFGTAAALDSFRRLELRREAELRTAALEADLARMELARSRAHVPPDYLRDVFRALSDRAGSDAQSAEELIVLLARFLRAVIDALTQVELTAADELRVLRAFVALETERTGKTIELPSEPDEDLTRPIPDLNLVSALIARRDEWQPAPTEARS